MSQDPDDPQRVAPIDAATITEALDAFANAPPGTSVFYPDVVDRFGLEGAVLFFEELASRYQAPSDALSKYPVGRALYGKGVALQALGRDDQALAAFDDALARCRDNADDPLVQADIARALYYKGLVLARLDRHEDALAAYDELIGAFGNSQEADARYQAVLGLSGKAYSLYRLKRHRAAFRTRWQIGYRYYHDTDPRIQLRLKDLALRKQLVRRIRRLG